MGVHGMGSSGWEMVRKQIGTNTQGETEARELRAIVTHGLPGPSISVCSYSCFLYEWIRSPFPYHGLSCALGFSPFLNSSHSPWPGEKVQACWHGKDLWLPLCSLVLPHHLLILYIPGRKTSMWLFSERICTFGNTSFPADGAPSCTIPLPAAGELQALSSLGK